MSTKADYQYLYIDDSFQNLNFKKFRKLLAVGLAEYFGTCIFVFIGCNSLVNTLQESEVNLLLLSLAFATGIGTSILCFMHISGTIMNPGLNLAMVILGHFSIYKLFYYTLWQMLGAITATALNILITPRLPDNFCVTLPNPEVGLFRAAATEFISMAILTFGLCAVVDPRKTAYSDGNYLKFTVIITALVIPAAKYSGCSINPARAFGPALLAWHWEYHWMYWLVPMSSAGVTALVYRLFFDHTIFEEDEKKDTNP